MSTPSKCKSCGASIVFERSATTGRMMPFDDPPKRLWLLVPGVGAKQVEVRETHFATCPSASQHRRPVAPTSPA